jgi:hypothetical protein
MRNLLSCLVLLLAQAPAFAQSDLIVTLHERTLNNLFAALGEFKGTEEYELMFIDRTLTWTLTGMHIELEKDSAAFLTQARVETDFGTYTDEVRGKVAIRYNEKSNLISVQVVDAPFEIAVNAFGRRWVIKRLQIADYLTTPFTFEGPLTLQNSLDFEMPDGTVRTIAAIPNRCTIQVLPNRIEVATNVAFKPKK